jgi:hypothetical protein
MPSFCADTEYIVTHGYFYDVAHNRAAWLDSTWSFDFERKEWERVQFDGAIPLARYSATCATYGGDLIMHGGDDGGESQGLKSYRHSFFAGSSLSQSRV